MAQILCVDGSARSGSTLLGEMLGSQPEAFNAGEILLVWRDLNRGGRCGCGVPIIECPCWSRGNRHGVETRGLSRWRRARLADTRARLAPSSQVPSLIRLAHAGRRRDLADAPLAVRSLSASISTMLSRSRVWGVIVERTPPAVRANFGATIDSALISVSHGVPV